jgi:hypothetical protein
VRRLPELDRRECRREFERRFLASRMALQYVDLYTRLLAHGPATGRRPA